MREYLEAFMKEQFYPANAREELIFIYDKIMADETLCDILCRALDVYENADTCEFEEILALCEELEQSSLIHEYTVNLIFFICLTPYLRDRYNRAGIDIDIWSDTVSELKYRMIECKDIKNIWGIERREGLAEIFEMKRFILGRLQFEIVDFGEILPNFEYREYGIFSDTQIINVHVPRMLKALDREFLEESYTMAEDFFGKCMPFVCNSWMLYPDYANVLGDGTDIRDFASDYEIVSVLDDNNRDKSGMREVFDMDFTGRAEDYPENTMLRKRFKEYLVNGGKTGRAIGIFIK